MWVLIEGVVYLVLKGVNFNGYDFVEVVVNVGVFVIIVSEKVFVVIFVIYVEDIKLVLG